MTSRTRHAFRKFHFARLFRSIYGRTPHQYRTDVRIRRAAELLCAGEPVERVCYVVGFESVSSFTGLFRRRIGQAPAAYQRAALKRLAEMAEIPVKFVPNCFVEKRGWKK